MKQLDNIVEMALRNKPETRESNDVLWVEIIKALCIVKGITNVDDMLVEVLKGGLPSSHSVVASASVIRKKHPELKPSSNSIIRKKEIKEQYAQNYRNA